MNCHVGDRRDGPHHDRPVPIRRSPGPPPGGPSWSKYADSRTEHSRMPGRGAVQACFDASSITVMSDGAPTRVGGPQAPAPRLT